MATTSLLRTMHDLHSAKNDPPGGWTSKECEVEVLANAISPTAKTFTNGTLGASTSGSIPASATEWSVTVLTGTATIGSATTVPAGFSASGSGPVAAATITFSTDAASSLYFQYLS